VQLGVWLVGLFLSPQPKEKPVTKRTCTGSEHIASSSKQTEIMEELTDQFSEMLNELLPESADFAEFEKTALEFGNELVRRALKKN
jgi:hypothetical protein